MAKNKYRGKNWILGQLPAPHLSVFKAHLAPRKVVTWQLRHLRHCKCSKSFRPQHTPLHIGYSPLPRAPGVLEWVMVAQRLVEKSIEQAKMAEKKQNTGRNTHNSIQHIWNLGRWWAPPQECQSCNTVIIPCNITSLLYNFVECDMSWIKSLRRHNT